MSPSHALSSRLSAKTSVSTLRYFMVIFLERYIYSDGEASGRRVDHTSCEVPAMRRIRCDHCFRIVRVWQRSECQQVFTREIDPGRAEEQAVQQILRQSVSDLEVLQTEVRCIQQVACLYLPVFVCLGREVRLREVGIRIWPQNTLIIGGSPVVESR